MNPIIRKIFAAGVEGTFYHQRLIKAVIINVFSYLAIIALGYYTVRGYIFPEEKGMTYAYAMSFFLSLTLANLIYFHYKKNFALASHFVGGLMTLLAFALVIRLGTGTTGLYWLYVYAPFTIFILGRKLGVVYTAIMFFSVIGLLQWSPDFMTHYPKELHSRFIFSYIIATSFPVIFEYVRYKTYLAFKKADNEKSNYLAQILQQKEEIQAQADQLAETAAELEKLSIAAAQTDSSILLADTEGKVEWVNEGYTRLTGYTMQFFNERFENILEASTKQNFRQLWENCIESKESVTYENEVTRRDGKKIWVQTTITPITDDNNNVVRLIAVGADISILKKAQAEIMQKNEEISAQKEELEKQHEAISAINDELRTQKDFIEKQNLQIHSSISYAKTIQNAILPRESDLKKYHDIFIIFRPKDIVSGDFYWHSEVFLPQRSLRYYAAVDCTGHGVPGAFMSMITARLMSEIITERGTYEPALILEQLNEAIGEVLKQDETENKDGLDICLVLEENEERQETKFTFSGAKRPLYIHRQSENKLEVIRGTRRSIGGINKSAKREFQNNDFKLSKGDILYLSSDGYIDQNDKNRRRLGSVKFKELLSRYAALPMAEQKKKLIEFMDKHSEGTVQRDDITILSIKY